MDIVRSLEEFVNTAERMTWAEAVFLDWHGVLCDEDKMREMYRHSPAVLFPHLSDKIRDWSEIEQTAYQDWLNRFRRLSAAGIAYSKVLAEADIAYYGRLVYGAGFWLEGPRSIDKWATRKWEEWVTRGCDVSDDFRRALTGRLRSFGFKVFVASSSSETHLEGTLRGSHYQELTDGVLSAEAIGHHKQTMEFWEVAFAKTKVRPDRALVLDDQPAMLEVPERMGARTFWLRNPDRNR
ncbi:MAG: HAD family hydrolase [bacterium JZ-2024 1]